MEQEYRLKKQDSFELKHIFDCGQCFRWKENEDGSYTGVIKDAVVKVQKIGDEILFRGVCKEELESKIRAYFCLDDNYLEMKQKLAKIDSFMRNSIEFGQGIRILQQDFWECIISFIISANNNIPRIQKIIERLSKEYGEKMEFEGQVFYLFPTPEELSKASIADLRKLGLGFRDKRVFATTQAVLKKEFDLEKVACMQDSGQIREELLKLDGVGPKVADCIMLFALKKFDVFPVDVWVRRVMNELYFHEKNEEKVSQKQLQKLAEEKFLGLSGIAQQYLFYWRRQMS